MKSTLVAVVGSVPLVASADAGFTGFVAYSRNVGANTVIDVFAAVTNASDRFLNVNNTVSNGVYVQKAGLATKTWKPDVAGFTSTRNTSDDSFMTAGTFGGGAYYGEYYASPSTAFDPNFPIPASTPGSAAQTTIPSNGGWYTGDPTSVDNRAELMSTWAGGFTRRDSELVPAASGSAAPPNSFGATYGIWCAHLVVAGNNKVIGSDFTFKASAFIKDGVSGATTPATYQFIPAPGALSLLLVTGVRRRNRRQREGGHG